MNVIDKVENFYESFNGKKGIIGCSEKCFPIRYFNLGSGRPKVIISGAIHAREYVTALTVLRFIEDFDEESGNFFFVPLVNPDGVKTCLNGKPMYKANANGVDLNVNFDARWGTGIKNVRHKADENYIGEYPFSESETVSLRDFTLLVNPDITLSFHTKGEEIYYEFFQQGEDLAIAYRLATAAAKASGYVAKKIVGSAGGYKDWCIEKLKIPSLTIEAGSDDLSHPIDESYADEIYKKVRNLPKAVADEWRKYRSEKPN